MVFKYANCHYMLCALFEATGRGNKIMIPSHYMCPDGWYKKYSGFIMDGHDDHPGGGMCCCFDEPLEQVKHYGSCETAYLLHLVGASRSHVPTTSKAFFCIVGTKPYIFKYAYYYVLHKRSYYS